MALKANIAANFVGQGWRALMALAFVPVFIRLLGMEAYGLIGLFASLQLWLGLLDLGIRPVLTREAARFTAGAHDEVTFWRLLRSLEWIAFSMAALAALALGLLSPWLASHWVKPVLLSNSQVTAAFMLMGAVAAIQMIESLYASALAGLQRQVVQNVIMTIVATMRALGSVGVLLWVDKSVTAYFLWQAAASGISAIALAVAIYRLLPRAPAGTGFRLSALRPVAGYAAGMVGITLVSIGMTQIDKLILANRIPLAEFGNYALATSVSMMIGVIVAPVGVAYQPRFTERVTQMDEAGLEHDFRMATQLAVLLAGVAAAMLIFFGERIVLLWTQDVAVSSQVGRLLPALAIGYGLHAIVSIGYLVQLSHGWTQLAIRLNVALLALTLPTLLVVIPSYGALGATWVWATTMLAYFTISTFVMLRRLLPQSWPGLPVNDVALPLTLVAGVGFSLSKAMPATAGLGSTLMTIFVAASVLFVSTLLALPIVRKEVAKVIRTAWPK